MKFHPKLSIAILSAACFSLAHLPALAEDTQASMPCPHVAPMAAADADKLIDIMRDNLKKMDVQLDKVRNSKDAATRDKALQEYALTLKENMRLSHGISPMMMPAAGMMEHGGMMDHGGMGHCMMMDHGGAHGMMGSGAAGDPDVRIQHLEKRMDLMQKRLDQLKKAKPASTK